MEDASCEGDTFGYCGEYETVLFDSAPSNNSLNGYNSTIRGCLCKESWVANDLQCDNYCCDPDGTGYDWCLVESGCTTGSNWGKCGPLEPECGPGCPISWVGDGYCDTACAVAEGCNFDMEDCTVTASTVDPSLLNFGAEFGDALRAENAALQPTWVPSEECSNINIGRTYHTI